MRRRAWYHSPRIFPALLAALLVLLVALAGVLGINPMGLVAGWWRRSVLFRWVAAAVGAVALIHLLRALFVDSRIAHTKLEYPSGKIPAQLDGYTAVFFSDIHLISNRRLRAAVQTANTMGADVALLGGDYTPAHRLDRCLSLLSPLQAADGIYGVAGNHDNAAVLEPAMKRHGMVLLQNSGVHLRDGLYLAGVEDLWTGHPQVEPAICGAKEDDLVLLLSHNPDTAMDLDTAGVDLMLAGHTHGGEITLFGLFAPALWAETRYGRRFGGGWAKGRGKTDIYVGRGVGRSLYALPRVFARPQVIYVTFRRRDFVDN